MNEYKKALIEIRNSYIYRKQHIEDKKVDILEKSFEKQRKYLDKKTFYLITSDNKILSFIGEFIAYVLKKRKIQNDLLDITTDDFNEFENLIILSKKYDLEYRKIMMVLEFMNSIDENEFNTLMLRKN